MAMEMGMETDTDTETETVTDTDTDRRDKKQRDATYPRAKSAVGSDWAECLRGHAVD
jgi:hypothetical protein